MKAWRSRGLVLGATVGVAIVAAGALFLLPALAGNNGDPVPPASGLNITPQQVQYGGNTFPCSSFTTHGATSSFQINNPKNGDFSIPGTTYVITLSHVTRTSADWTSNVNILDLGVNGGSFTAWYRYEEPYAQYGTTGYFNGRSDSVGVQGDTNVHATQKSPNALYNLSYMTFCYSPPSATIAGTVWSDTNGNGTRESGENGLPARTVNLYVGSTSTPAASTQTDANGAYTFGNRPLGQTDRVCLVGQSGFTQTFPISGASCTGPGERALGYGFTLSATRDDSFGEAPDGTIAVALYEDMAKDGSQSAGDPALSGWTVWLDRNTNGIKDAGEPAATTDTSGSASFVVKPGATYQICQVRQSGWFSTSGSDCVVSASAVLGGSTTNVSLGDYRKASITANVFWDKANDHGFDPGTDVYQSGWRVYLDLNNDGLYTTSPTPEPSALTDASGNITALSVDPGTYKVCEVVQAGWLNGTPTSASGGCVSNVQLVSNGTSSTAFGNYQQAPVSGTVYSDLDGNGGQDAGEPGIGGLTVTLVDPSSNLIISTATTGDGSPGSPLGQYSFPNRYVGLGYKVCLAKPAGIWIQTQPSPPLTSDCNVGDFSGAQSGTVASSPGSTADFGIQEQQTVSGTVYADTNQNGEQDSGEPAQSGWEVRLYAGAATAPVGTDTSSAEGTYSILIPKATGGPFRLCEAPPSGTWGQTQPAPDRANLCSGTGELRKGYESGAAPAYDTLDPFPADSVTRNFGNVPAVSCTIPMAPDSNIDGVEYEVHLASCKDMEYVFNEGMLDGKPFVSFWAVDQTGSVPLVPVIEKLSFTTSSPLQNPYTIKYDDVWPYPPVDATPPPSMEGCAFDPRSGVDEFELQSPYDTLAGSADVLGTNTSCIVHVEMQEPPAPAPGADPPAPRYKYTWIIYSKADLWRSGG